MSLQPWSRETELKACKGTTASQRLLIALGYVVCRILSTEGVGISVVRIYAVRVWL